MSDDIHWGPDPGHGGLIKHKGTKRDCAGPDCGPLPGECLCGDLLDEDGDCPRCAHGIGAGFEYADCGTCGAILDSWGRCPLCDSNWIWAPCVTPEGP